MNKQAQQSTTETQQRLAGNCEHAIVAGPDYWFSNKPHNKSASFYEDSGQ